MVTGKCTAQVVDNSWGRIGPIIDHGEHKIFAKGNSNSNLMTMKGVIQEFLDYETEKITKIHVSFSV